MTTCAAFSLTAWFFKTYEWSIIEGNRIYFYHFNPILWMGAAFMVAIGFGIIIAGILFEERPKETAWRVLSFCPFCGTQRQGLYCPKCGWKFEGP